MSILGFGKKATVPAAQTPLLNGVPVTQSGYGNYVPISIGVNRATMNLTGLWDFLRTTVTTPGQSVGKGIGGGGSTPATTSTTYSTAFQALLCFGYVDHIDAVWTSNGKVPVQQISTNFTVPGIGGHIDINDPGFNGDRGVGYLTSYSATVSDFGSGTTPTLSGSYLVAGESGTTTSAGVYVVSNPSAGVTRYTFGAADGGKTVSINYTTTFTTITETAEIVIPGSATYSVPSPSTFVGNSTVNYSATSNQLFGPGDHLVAGVPVVVPETVEPVEQSLAEQTLTAAELLTAARSIWVDACMYDGIDPNSKFVVLSPKNPFVQFHSTAMSRYFASQSR